MYSEFILRHLETGEFSIYWITKRVFTLEILFLDSEQEDGITI